MSRCFPLFRQQQTSPAIVWLGLGSGGRGCLHSISNMVSALPLIKRIKFCDRLRLEIRCSSLSPRDPIAYERQLCANSGQSKIGSAGCLLFTQERTCDDCFGLSEKCQTRKLIAMVVTRYQPASVHRLYGYRVPTSPLTTGPNSTPCSPLKRDICISSSGK